MIKFHGIENITPRIRKFAAEFPNKAARAMRDAADMTVIDRARQLFQTPGWIDGTNPKKPNNWKGDLSDSLRAKTTRQSGTAGQLQKYSTLIIEYGPVQGSISSKNYWKRFEAGGKHGDWPLKRIAQWLQEKWGMVRDEAYPAARKFIEYLEQNGATEYPLLETAWEDSKEQFITEWRANLRTQLNGSSGSLPF